MITERPEKRARNLALVGLGWSVVLTAFFILVMLWTQSEALRGLTFLSSCGILIWLYLVLVYHQRLLVQEEFLETEQLRREREAGLASGAIFDLDKEELLLAQRRLQWMYRWLLPSFTILIVAGLAVMGLVLWPWRLGESVRMTEWPEINAESARLAIWFIGGVAFLSFLLSRYASGMARYPEWRMLRSGASWLMGVTLGAVAISATLAPLHYADVFVPERVVAYVLRLLLVVLAIETLFNFVLDFYRPRKPGEEPRPAFDSRLLGLFSEPGGIARSIAEAVNYQFGFEVSSSWLYKLLERAALPLAGFAVLVLFLASSFVIVQADQQAVIERFGNPHRVVDPGITLKLPWPIDVAYKVQTQQVHELRLGEVPEKDPRSPSGELILWTNQHESEPHLNVLIATPQLKEFINAVATSRPAEARTISGAHRKEGPTFAEAGAAVSVSILRVAMTIQYEINDAKEWISRYQDPEAMLKAIASHELTHYCAFQTVEAMLGKDRGRIEQDLWKRIDAASQKSELGIKVKFLGLQGIHPPEKTAEAFQDVIGAEQKRVASIKTAEAGYNKQLSEVAGNVETAEALDAAIRLASDPKASEADRMKSRERVHNLVFGNTKERMNPVGGEASGIIAKARAERWQLENTAKAEATVFQAMAAVKNVAPEVFFLREKLKAFADAMGGIRKYVIAAKGKVDVKTFHLNLQDPANAALNFAAGTE